VNIGASCVKANVPLSFASRSHEFEWYAGVTRWRYWCVAFAAHCIPVTSRIRRMLRFIRSDQAGRKPRDRATFERTSHVVAYVDRRGGQEHWVMESAATSILTWLAQSGRANCSARRMPRPVDPRRPRRRVPTARRTHLVPRSSFYMGRNPARLFRMAAGSPSSQRCVSDHPSFRMSIALRLRSRPRKAAHYRRCGPELAPQDARSRTTCAFALQCFGIFPLAFMLRMHG
jgi:hypothetical protein